MAIFTIFTVYKRALFCIWTDQLHVQLYLLSYFLHPMINLIFSFFLFQSSIWVFPVLGTLLWKLLTCFSNCRTTRGVPQWAALLPKIHYLIHSYLYPIHTLDLYAFVCNTVCRHVSIFSFQLTCRGKVKEDMLYKHQHHQYLTMAKY